MRTTYRHTDHDMAMTGAYLKLRWMLVDER